MYYPRSFLKFILLGFLLVTMPLVYALGELILSLDRLQTQGQRAVQEAAQAGRASRQLFEQAVSLERLVRQYLILDDSALLEDYARLRQEFRQTAGQLALLPLAPDQQKTLAELTESEARLSNVLNATPRTTETQLQLADGFAHLAEQAQSMLAASNGLTERAIERLQDIATEGRQKWLYLAAATAGIALALAILFAVLIARPIRQLDQAIRQLGTADFLHPIEVNGPQDLRYLGQRLEWLRSRLSDLEEQQNRFLRHVSHELKTPLTAVREGTELLRDRVGGDLSREQQDIVRIVRENCLQLQKLIEDLLRYHQTRAMEPQAQGPVSLPEIVRNVTREHKLAALARMIAFDAQLQPVVVQGDAERIRTIVDNLVSNAIKYSPRAGAITLRLSVEKGWAVLDVMDEGHGVPEDERDRIFESFYQGKVPVVQGRVKGSGLGLAIAREYALAHEGSIEVRDRTDGKRGALFTLRLPIAGAGATGAKAAVPPKAVANAVSGQ
ncbi:MAG TPA: ATP-binding protein [Casimicrobiaceae bacterium]|nr:ATP-binding protein [Casimicrobiaceae bacterium]